MSEAQIPKVGMGGFIASESKNVGCTCFRACYGGWVSFKHNFVEVAELSPKCDQNPRSLIFLCNLCWVLKEGNLSGQRQEGKQRISHTFGDEQILQV